MGQVISLILEKSRRSMLDSAMIAYLNREPEDCDDFKDIAKCMWIKDHAIYARCGHGCFKLIKEGKAIMRQEAEDYNDKETKPS